MGGEDISEIYEVQVSFYPDADGLLYDEDELQDDLTLKFDLSYDGWREGKIKYVAAKNRLEEFKSAGQKEGIEVYQGDIEQLEEALEEMRPELLKGEILYHLEKEGGAEVIDLASMADLAEEDYDSEEAGQITLVEGQGEVEELASDLKEEGEIEIDRGSYCRRA